jgi:hypothetical protein
MRSNITKIGKERAPYRVLYKEMIRRLVHDNIDLGTKSM